MLRMRIRLSILYLLLLQLCVHTLQAQDPVFTHFFANSLHLNPSLAGMEGPARIYTGYRNQWPNSGAAYVTYQASFDKYVEKLGGGLGVKVLNDKQGGGIFNAYNLDVMYAYHIRATRKLSFSGALQAGIGQRSFNPSNLVFGDMIDPVTGGSTGMVSESMEAYSEFYPDFAVGASVFYEQFYGGIAVHHLLQPVVTDANDPTGTVPRKYSVHLGAMFPIIENRRGTELMRLSPNVVYIQQLSVQQLNYGLDVIFRNFLAGIWTRHDPGFNYGNLIFTTGYTTGSLRFRYSYDVKLSSPTVRIPNLGAHEISLLLILEQDRSRFKHRAIKCPKI